MRKVMFFIITFFLSGCGSNGGEQFVYATFLGINISSMLAFKETDNLKWGCTYAIAKLGINPSETPPRINLSGDILSKRLAKPEMWKPTPKTPEIKLGRSELCLNRDLHKIYGGDAGGYGKQIWSILESPNALYAEQSHESTSILYVYAPEERLVVWLRYGRTCYDDAFRPSWVKPCQ